MTTKEKSENGKPTPISGGDRGKLDEETLLKYIGQYGLYNWKGLLCSLFEKPTPEDRAFILAHKQEFLDFLPDIGKKQRR